MNASNISNETVYFIKQPTINPRPQWYWVLLGIVSFLATIGNGLVIYVIVTRRRRLLTSPNCFVMSLSVADFLIGFFLPPMAPLAHLYPDIFDRKIYYTFYNSMMSIAVINIFSMTFDRFLGVVFPLRYQHWMTTPRVIFIIVNSWIFPVVLSFLPLTWAGHDKALEINRIYTSCMLAIFEFIPPVIMLLMYTRIVTTARRHARQTAAQINQLKYNNQIVKGGIRDRTERSVRVIGAVVLLFVGCWLLDIYKSICWHFKVCEIHNTFVNISVVLLFFNSAVNPIVYALLKRDFKRELSKMMCCCTWQGIESTFEMTERSDRAARNSIRSVYGVDNKYMTNRTDLP